MADNKTTRQDMTNGKKLKQQALLKLKNVEFRTQDFSPLIESVLGRSGSW